MDIVFGVNEIIGVRWAQGRSDKNNDGQTIWIVQKKIYINKQSNIVRAIFTNNLFLLNERIVRTNFKKNNRLFKE